MGTRAPRLFREFRPPAWLAGVLVVLGLGIFLLQAIRFAHTTASSLDEGAYLYKGYLFASGQYRPFEPYGPQTNKAPLAFLIPGYAQLVFGPGLRTGRYLAVAFGLFTAITAWWIARRLTNQWLAIAVVWIYALSPALIRTYSEGVTQSAIAFLLALVLAFSLGRDRAMWQLVLGGFFAGLLIMVRQNMVLVLPLLILYIWWQYGWKAALACGLAGTSVLVFFHALYWPGINQLWTDWLPRQFRVLFPGYSRVPGTRVWNPNMDLADRWLSFFQAVRFNFVPITGFLFAILLWPTKSGVIEKSRFRDAVFLGVLFIGLLLMHSWASISNDYCVFCFAPYIAFFHVTAVLFVALLIQTLVKRPHPIRQILVALVTLFIFAGLGYSAFEDIGDQLLKLNVPRMRGGQVLSGLVPLWDLISNKFHIERNLAEKAVSTLAGLALGLVILLVGFLIYRAVRKQAAGYAYVLAVFVLVFGLAFSPLLAGSGGHAECPGVDIIADNEQIGTYLRENIPPGSTVFWHGGLSVAPMLYVTQAHIYLPQINDGYSHRTGGDPDQLLRFGFWNSEMSQQWMKEAEFIIVEGWRYSNMRDALDPAVFDELPRSPAQTSCLKGSGLRLFRRK